MTQPTLLVNNVYAVEVPEGAENIRVSQLIGTPKLFADIPSYLYAAKLPPGSWQLIGTTKEVTDEQAKGIVGSSEWHFPARHTRYIDYTHPYGSENKQAWSIGFANAIESLTSLLSSKGLDINKIYVLVRMV